MPAGCLRAACRAGAACCRSLCCAAGTACLLGPCCSDRTPARDLFSLAAPGGVRGCWRCCVGVGWVQKRVWWSRFEWSTGFEFLAVSSMSPAQFRCQLNSQRKSRHLTGPGRTLVYIQRTSSARAVSPPTQRLPIQGPYSDLLIRCGARPNFRFCYKIRLHLCKLQNTAVFM